VFLEAKAEAKIMLTASTLAFDFMNLLLIDGQQKFLVSPSVRVEG
jgi:hypothetical protein